MEGVRGCWAIFPGRLVCIIYQVLVLSCTGMSHGYKYLENGHLGMVERGGGEC